MYFNKYIFLMVAVSRLGFRCAVLSEREREELLVCALRLKQTWGFLNQASHLGGMRDPERDSKSPKGSELGYGFWPSHFPLGKSQRKCAFYFYKRLCLTG